MTNKLTRSHEEATIARFRRDPELATLFIKAILKEGDQNEVAHARTLLTKAFGEDAFRLLLG